jgi:hypothetical protein
MNTNLTPEQVRELIEKLFKDAGYTAPDLLIYLENLQKDNELLAQNIHKMKLDSVRKASAAAGMNSRLKDALRE